MSQQKIKIFSSIFDVSKNFNSILLDAYGVFWNGNAVGLFPGAQEAMEQLVLDGKIVGILSNSTQLAAKEIEKLRGHGLIKGQHFHFMTTSGQVAKHFFSKGTLPFKISKKKFFLFGKGYSKFFTHEAIFQDTPYEETEHLHDADFIYVSIPHINGEDQTDPSVFREEIKKIRNFSNIPMVCANPDKFAHEGIPPKIVVRQGSIAALYEELGGEVFYIGKPSNLAYKAAMEYFNTYDIFHPSQVLMVGDTPETDIRGARSFGMPSALITKTGIMADRISHIGLDDAINNISSTDIPTFFIERLANNAI